MKKNRIGIIVFNLLLFMVVYANSKKTAAGITGLAYDVEIAELQEYSQNRTGLLVDVRTKAEHAMERIPGSINIDWNNGGEFETEFQKLDENSPVFIYCRTGVRSKRAKKALLKMGFQKVYNLKYGFLSWKEQGLPVDSTPGFIGVELDEGEEGC